LVDGRYRVDAVLGEGGMATVYRALDLRLRRDVALKVVKGSFAEEPDFLTRFEREAVSLAQLRHPNIVQVFDYGKENNVPYLVMAYIAGGSLSHHISGAVPWRRAAEWLAPVARALEYAHRRNMLHRDIKPANLLLDANGQFLLSDFGIVKIVGDQGSTGSLTATGGWIGTPDYMAPEQWLGEPVPQSDIYSLGIVLYELVTGQRPFQDATPVGMFLKHREAPVIPPRQLRGEVPSEIDALVCKALAKRPEERFASMAEFATALETAVKDLPSVYQPRGEALPLRQAAGAETRPGDSAPKKEAEGAQTVKLEAEETSVPLPTLDLAPAYPADKTVRPGAPTSAAENGVVSVGETVKAGAVLVKPVRSKPKPAVWVWGGAALAGVALLAVAVALIINLGAGGRPGASPGQTAAASTISVEGALVQRTATLAASPAQRSPTVTATQARPTPTFTPVPTATLTPTSVSFRNLDEIQLNLVWENVNAVRPGEFLYPEMIAVDASDRVYVTDASARVQVISSAGKFLTSFGKYGRGDGEFQHPEGIAVGKDGRVYVADKLSTLQNQSAGRIEVFNSTGLFQMSFGKLENPSGVAIGPDGLIYVVEQGAGQVVVFTADGVETGRWGSPGKQVGEFNFNPALPSGIGVDSNGNVYVSDTNNNRVQVFDAKGTFIRQFGQKGSENGDLDAPLGLAVNVQTRGLIYVVDGNNRRVEVYNNFGQYMETIGKSGQAPGQFGGSLAAPEGLGGAVLDSKGRLLIADSGNHRVQVFALKPAASLALTFGKAAFNEPAELINPSGIVNGTGGNVIVLDSGHRQFKVFKLDGTLADSYPLDSRVINPTGLQKDLNDNLYFMDAASSRIYQYNVNFQPKNGWGGAGDPLNLAEGSFACLADIVVYQDQLYASDPCAGQIDVFNLMGEYITRWTPTGADGTPAHPYSLCSDMNGMLLMVDGPGNRLLKTDLSGKLVKEFPFDEALRPYAASTAVSIGPMGFLFLRVPAENRVILLDSSGRAMGNWNMRTSDLAPLAVVFADDGSVVAAGMYSLRRYTIPLTPGSLPSVGN
jgi:serine/threonine-protein kinase